MGKPIGLKQGLQGLLSLAVNVDWEAVDSDIFQTSVIEDPIEAGKQLTAFLKDRAKMLIGEIKSIVIDRSKRFNPAEFIGAGWTIEEEDERSLALTELDITSVRLEHMLKSGEEWVKGEDKLTRLKDAGYVRLDAGIFLTLWQNQHLIPTSWKELTNGNTTFIYFDGTILRDSDGRRCVLCLCWRGGQWDWVVRWLDYRWRARRPSAVLARPND